MFSVSYDAAYGLAVFLFSGTTNTDADFQAYCDSIRSLRLRLLAPAWDGPGGPHACAISVVDPGNPIPDARWRRAIAAESADVPASVLFALVTESPIVRGVLTAINWLRPPQYAVSVHVTFSEAVAWMERRRGAKLPHFPSLLKEARERAARGDRLG